MKEVRKKLNRTPLEIQPGESLKAFEAWRIYRDLGYDRTCSAVAKTLHRHPSLIAAWNRRWNWQHRVFMHEKEQDKIRAMETLKLSREAGRRHLNQALVMQQHLINRLQSMSPEDLGVDDIRKWFETAVKIERLSLGMSTESIKTVTEPVLPDDTHEEIDISDPETVKLACDLTARIIHNQKANPEG